MATIHNPVLRGFHPDPSILRVGEDYYFAVSSFEWFPGVPVYHSRNLAEWELIGHSLAEPRLLDMRGTPDSGGVWAPCLSYSDGTYYLIYSNVKSLAGAFKDTPNYLIAGPSPVGPWSDPVFLNASGFDPSLFHDDDGRKWLLNMVWDHRKGRNPFHGIVIREYDAAERKLVGPTRLIYRGTELGCTEGPHLYKKDGWYYLVTAEGGTGYRHAVTMARSRELFGPYETDPENPILTSRNMPDLDLQKAGHASLVETPDGQWYLAHLCARPLEPLGRCPLGRETALQRCFWQGGWLRVEGGGRPQLQVPGLQDDAQDPSERSTVATDNFFDPFDKPVLGLHYATLREPFAGDWGSLTERPGYLRLRGRASLQSLHGQSMVAHRLPSFRCRAETAVEFSPSCFQQMAGLVLYYNTKNWYYLSLSLDEGEGMGLTVVSCDNGRYDELGKAAASSWSESSRLYLRAVVDHARLQFAYSVDGEEWRDIGPVLDMGRLSDEAATRYSDGYFTDWGFTGAFIGLCAQDLSGELAPADFDYFSLVGY